MIASTSESETEPNEVFVTKLALSMGRSKFGSTMPLSTGSNYVASAILRPKQENELSIQDRHTTREPILQVLRSAYAEV